MVELLKWLGGTLAQPLTSNWLSEHDSDLSANHAHNQYARELILRRPDLVKYVLFASVFHSDGICHRTHERLTDKL